MTSAQVVSRRRRTGWVLPVVLVVAMFGIPSWRGGMIVSSQGIPELIQSVLMQPLSESVPVLLPIAKFALLVVAIMGVLGRGPYSKVVLGYYAAILAVMAVFQNVAALPGGLAIVLGNTVVQLVVVVVCVLGLRRTTAAAPLLRERLWLLPLMLWAWLYPFAVDAGVVVSGGWTGVLTNAAGVTYCMVTPVIAGTMALRPAAYGRTTRALVGWLGSIFGLLNMVTWFVINPESWWMGILHVPLLIVAGFLTITSWREGRRIDTPHQHPELIEEELAMSDEQAAPQSRGVSVELLGVVDLGAEIDGMARRQLRMRRVTFEPGAVFGPVHDHVGRPGTVYILQGTITDHRDGVAREYGPGLGWPEDRSTTHWLENTGTESAVEISVDIVEAP